MALYSHVPITVHVSISFCKRPLDGELSNENIQHNDQNRNSYKKKQRNIPCYDYVSLSKWHQI